MKSLLFLTIALFALSGCDYEEVEREIGYKGRARVNPWLAAERFTSAMDWEVESVISWTAPDWDDAVWMMPAATLSNESFTRMSERWVRKGGHLILLVDYADAEKNDWLDRLTPPVLEPALFTMLQRAGIELRKGETSSKPVNTEMIRLGGRDFEVEASAASSVVVAGGVPGVFASVKSGDGRISVLTDARIFRNRWIGEHDHADLFHALIEESGYVGTVGFMRGSGLSLWSLLREYLWPVLLAMALWLALWLWKSLTRFGPIERETSPAESRGFEHHLEALGNFQWRLDRGASLLVPLREQIVELGQRTSIRAGCRDDDFFQFLADRAGLPRERVFRALSEKAPADAAILTRTTADLQQLLQVLDHSSMP